MIAIATELKNSLNRVIWGWFSVPLTISSSAWVYKILTGVFWPFTSFRWLLSYVWNFIYNSSLKLKKCLIALVFFTVFQGPSGPSLSRLCIGTGAPGGQYRHGPAGRSTYNWGSIYLITQTTHSSTHGYSSWYELTFRLLYETFLWFWLITFKSTSKIVLSLEVKMYIEINWTILGEKDVTVARYKAV